MTPNDTLQIRALAATLMATSQRVRQVMQTLRRVKKSLKWPAPDMHRSSINIAYERLPLSWN